MQSRLEELFEQLRAIEQSDSGLLRTTAMMDQKDPSRVQILVMFESEARARESGFVNLDSPQRAGLTLAPPGRGGAAA